MEDRFWIWFSLIFGFGSDRGHQLLEAFGSPREIYQLLEGGLAPKDLLKKRESENWRQCMVRAKEIEEITLKKGCQIVTPDHPDYPAPLQEIYGKPAVLYVKGDLGLVKDRLTIAMVGARRHTDYGQEVAEFLAEGLATAGAVVVSGLANGIDSICLGAAYRAGGATVGVLPCGLDVDYPKGNLEIKTKIASHGAVVSEFPMGTQPHRHNFAPRNRILAGMSQGVVVVEAGSGSGALVTAEYASSFSRDLFVPPGGIFSGTFGGSHWLLSQGGAKLVASPQDILEEYPLFDITPLEELPEREGAPKRVAPKKKSKRRLTLPDGMDPAVRVLYEAINWEKKTPDQLASETGLSMGELLGILTTLEILGLAVGYPGGYITLP